MEFASLKGWANLLRDYQPVCSCRGLSPIVSFYLWIYGIQSFYFVEFGKLNSHQPLSTPSFSLRSNPAMSSLPWGLPLIFNHRYDCVKSTCKTLALTFMQGYLRHSYQSPLLWQIKSTSQGSNEAENKSSLPLPWIPPRGAEGEPYRDSARLDKRL